MVSTSTPTWGLWCTIRRVASMPLRVGMCLFTAERVERAHAALAAFVGLNGLRRCRE